MVYKENNQEKISKDGRCWYFRCYYTDKYGNRKQKNSRLYESKTIAKDEERKFLSKVQVVDETDENISFTTAYNDWWNVKKSQIKITTQYSLKKKLDNHIFNWFKPYKLHSIKWNILNEWRDELLSKDISEEYKNSIIGYMKEFLKYAIDNFEFDKKVASKLQKQKISKHKEQVNDAEFNFWTFEEFKKFISTVENDFDKIMYKFLYYTGLRLGECIALKWKDIDLEKKKVKIDKNFTNKIEGEIYAIVDPKTSNSFRTIDIDDNLVKELKNYKEQEQKKYNFNENAYVFGFAKYTAPSTFQRHLDNWIKKIEIKRITPHGFRHSHASLLIYLGCDSRDVADRLGDTIEVIEKTYAHLFPEKRKITIERLNNLNF